MFVHRAILCLAALAAACQSTGEPTPASPDASKPSFSTGGATSAASVSGGMDRAESTGDAATEPPSISPGTYRAPSCRYPGDDVTLELIVAEDSMGENPLTLHVICPKNGCDSKPIEGSESEYEEFRDALSLNRSGSSQYTQETALVATRPGSDSITAELRYATEFHYGDVFRSEEPGEPCTTVFRLDTIAPTVEAPERFSQTDPITIYFSELTEIDRDSTNIDSRDAFSMSHPTDETDWARRLELQPNFLWTPGSHTLTLGDVRDAVGNVREGLQVDVIVESAPRGSDNPSFEQDDMRHAWPNCTRTRRDSDSPSGDGEWLGVCGDGSVLIDVPEGAQTMSLEAGLSTLHRGFTGRIIVTSKSGVVASWALWPPGVDAGPDVYYEMSVYSAEVRAEDGPYKLRIDGPPGVENPLFGYPMQEVYLDALRFE